MYFKEFQRLQHIIGPCRTFVLKYIILFSEKGSGHIPPACENVAGSLFFSECEELHTVMLQTKDCRYMCDFVAWFAHAQVYISNFAGKTEFVQSIVLSLGFCKSTDA